uniref:Uncharacterized protein n=1 Tax=virus sp. ctoC338 TaxID=2827997 RepID=A0A8S5SXH4_9VIRU|nr:MAG TPA: hypothetical protein [virus sp. ctoC338]
MANKTFNTRVKNKRDTAANWEAVATTFQPLDGELIIVDTSAGKTRFKVGRYDTAKGRLLYYNEIPFADEYLYNDLNESQGKIYDKLKGIDDKSIIEMTLEPTNGNGTTELYKIGLWQFPQSGFYKIKFSVPATSATLFQVFARETGEDGTTNEDFSTSQLKIYDGLGGDAQTPYIFVLADYLDNDSFTSYHVQFLNVGKNLGQVYINTYDKSTQKWSYVCQQVVKANKVSNVLTLTKGDTTTKFDGSTAQTVSIPTKTSELTNDSNFTTQTDLDNLTNTVVSYNAQENITDEQKATARTNIGAVSSSDLAQSDWDQNDTTAKDYIKNRICYEKTSQQDIAGLKIYNVNYKGEANPDLPFQLGQIWNADYGTSSTDNLEVKQSDDGMLYIGTLTVNDTPFYIGTTSSGYNSSWVSAMHPNDTMVLTGVSGTYSTKEIVQIPSKFVPRDSLVINSYNSTGTSDYILDKTYEDITNALADNRMVFIKAENTIFRLNYIDTNNNNAYVFKSMFNYSVNINNHDNINIYSIVVYSDNTNKRYYSTLLDINQNIITVTNGDVKLYANPNTGEKDYFTLSSISDPNSTSKIYPESYTINFSSKKSNTQPKVVFSGTRDNDLSGMSVDVGINQSGGGSVPIVEKFYSDKLKIFNNVGDTELSGESLNLFSTNNNLSITSKYNITLQTEDSEGYGNIYVRSDNSKSKFIVQMPSTVLAPTEDMNPATKKYVDDQMTTVNNQLGGLTGAMHFIGKATVDITDGSTTDPQIANYTTKEKGDVILGKDDHKEFVWNGAIWEELGDEGSYALKTTTINGKALSDNITLTASDVGAASASTIETMQAAIDSKPSAADAVYTATAESTDGVAYTATVSGIDSLTVGASFIMVPNKTSASQEPTLNVNGLGAKKIRRRLNNLVTVTSKGYSNTWISANKPFSLIYDGTYWIVEGMEQPVGADMYGTVPMATADANGNNIADTYATIAMLQSMLPKVTTINLVAGWGGNSSPYYQDVTLSCCTETSVVDLQPTPAQLASWQDEGLAFTTQSGNGIVRVYVAGGKPSGAISIQVKVQEVVEV